MSVFAELSPPYSTIVADPPWHYEERLAGWDGPKGRVEGMPYSTMTTDEIASLPVAEIAAPNAHLYLWTTNRYLWDCREIVHGWGFEAVQVLVWCKPPRWRPGGLFGNATEFIVYARNRRRRQEGNIGALVKGAREAAGKSRTDLVPVFLPHYKNAESVKAQFANWELGKNTPSDRDWALLVEHLPQLRDVQRPEVVNERQSSLTTNWWTWSGGPHSVKPPAFMDIVEQVSPGPYVELFARAPRLGWDAWGKGYESAVAS